MILKSKALVLTLLLGLLALPALADHRGAGGPGIGEGSLTNPRFLIRYLGLSSTQVTQLQGFLKTLQTSIQSAQTAQPALCQQLRTDVGASHPDPTTVGKDYLALVDNQERVAAALEAFDTSFSAILNADQLAKYEALKQALGLDRQRALALPGCPPPPSS